MLALEALQGRGGSWRDMEGHGGSRRVDQSLTSLSPPLLGPVDVVLQLDADLALVGQVSDVGVLQQLLGARPLAVTLHQAALDERLELLGPAEPTRFRIQEENSNSETLLRHSPLL